MTDKTEITVLQEEYQRLTEEMRSRYAHHYHFHYVALVIAGALVALLSRENIPDPVLISVFLAGPPIFFPVIVLMLKEHAYIDLRERYIVTVLKPRFERLLNRTNGHEDRSDTTLGWYPWEQFAIRGGSTKYLIFGLFGMSEYLLPLFLSACSIVVSWVLLQSKWSILTTVVFALDIMMLLIGFALILMLRICLPHLPKEERPTKTTNAKDAEPEGPGDKQ